MSKKIFFLLLILLFVFHFFFRVYGYRGDYLSEFNPDYWEDRYLQSQWVVGDSKNPIGDDGLYAYAGWEYIHGKDPTILNAEMPPLGKYLIGLSILVFGNQNLFALICGALVLVSFYKLNLCVFKEKFLAFLPVFFFSLEPIFYGQLRAPFLDLLQLLFLILTLFFLIKDRIFLTVIFLGMMISVKATSALFLLITLTILSYLFFRKKKELIKSFFIFLPISLLVFVLTYVRFFMLGHNFWEFLKVQKWIINFYAIGAKGEALNVWQMFLLGRWSTWWGGLTRVDEWMITWPILLITLFIAIFMLKNSWRRESHFFLLTFWVFVYLIFLSFIPTWPRYLLLVLPFMYNLFVWVLLKNILGKS